MTDGLEQRHISTTGAVLMLVGLVIGVSIFILPGQLAVAAGPGVILAYALASVVALAGCLVAAQVGAVLPVSGGTFVLISRCISPGVAFVAVWMVLGGTFTAVALLALGFAEYVKLFWPGAPGETVAITVVVCLGLLNMVGARTAVLGQGVLTALLLAALVGFAGFGLGHIDPGNLDPFLPMGIDAAVAAAVPAFFSFTGFLLILEIGGEVKDPGRTFPRALLVSFAIVLVTYLTVSLVVVGVLHFSTYEGSGAPIGLAARSFLPGWSADAIAVTALLATLTSLNAILLGYARDLLALARNRLLPAALARCNRQGVPHWSVAVMTILSVVAILAGGTILQYATVIVVAVMVLQMLAAVAVWRMPRVLRAEFEAAEFKLAPVFWYGSLIALFVSSGFFAWVGGQNEPELLLGLSVFGGAGAAYYVLRRWWLTMR